jgi:hypothetical protein
LAQAQSSIFGPKEWPPMSHFCRICLEHGRVLAATIAGHIMPHEGDVLSFRIGRIAKLVRVLPFSIK